LVRPRVILVLGRHALERMLPGVGPISRVHGTLVQRGEFAFIPLYHPAAALHNGSLVGDLQKDFDHVREYLDRLLQPEEKKDDADGQPQPEQLSLIE
jgi:DNA polymerase